MSILMLEQPSWFQTSHKGQQDDRNADWTGAASCHKWPGPASLQWWFLAWPTNPKCHIKYVSPSLPNPPKEVKVEGSMFLPCHTINWELWFRAVRHIPYVGINIFSLQCSSSLRPSRRISRYGAEIAWDSIRNHSPMQRGIYNAVAIPTPTCVSKPIITRCSYMDGPCCELTNQSMCH